MSAEHAIARTGDPVLALAAEIVSAYVASNHLAADAVPDAIKGVYATLLALATGTEVVPAAKPAVPVKKSVHPDYLVCLEDGKKLKMLKRYLHSRYGMTPDDYRAKWQLPSDYPMVAASYAATRSMLAKKFGLGHSVKTQSKKR